MIKQANTDIRTAIADAGLRHWQVAYAMNTHEVSFSRRLKAELPIEEKQKIYAAIEHLKGVVNNA